MKQKHVTRKDILFLSVSMFIIVALWILFNVYHAWVTSTITDDLKIQIIPISPKFDLQTLDKLKTREKIEPVFELNNIVVENSSTPSGELTPTLEESVQIEEPIITTEPIPTEPEIVP